MVEEGDKGGGRGEGGGIAEACPICLEPISGEAFLDQCFHRFCFHCILQWSEMLIAKPQSTSSRLQCLKCPLCKSRYTSIIHDVSGAKFERHFILTPEGTRYQRLDGHIQRQAVYTSEVEQKLSRLTNVVPKPNRWLSVWVQRELQVIMQIPWTTLLLDVKPESLYRMPVTLEGSVTVLVAIQEDDVDTVKQHVVGVVEAFYKRAGGETRISSKGGAKTKDPDWHTTVATAVQPFIFEHAEKFAAELGAFLLSKLEIVAYDRQNQLRASVAGQLALLKKAKSQESLEENSRKNTTFDLYDEDVDVEGFEVMVGRSIEPGSQPSISDQLEQTTKAEHPSGGETSESMDHYNLEEDTQAQSSRHPRKNVRKKQKKKSFSPSDHTNNEGSHSNGKQHKEESKNRKRVRSSSNSPSGES